MKISYKSLYDKLPIFFSNKITEEPKSLAITLSQVAYFFPNWEYYFISWKNIFPS
jgi:hypothetical protein